MLVVTRKKNESILIGDDIEIVVVKIDDSTVKLAVNAPRNVTILRKELLKEISEENENSISHDVSVLKNVKK